MGTRIRSRLHHPLLPIALRQPGHPCYTSSRQTQSISISCFWRTVGQASLILQSYDANGFDAATAAIRHVVGCFSDYCQASHCGFWYGYHRDSHTSLVGPRETASQVAYFQSDAEVEEWLQGSNDVARLDRDNSIGLFAFPGQSNLTGRRLPLNWPGRVRSLPHKDNRRTFTLLDAAALASTAQIDLSDGEAAPDFTALSLYKIFGFPDLGVLLIRKASAFLLSKRRFFGGGTVDMIVNSTNAEHDWVARKAHTIERHEDGTLPFHSIIALKSAMAVHSRLYGSMANISAHTSHLVEYLFQQMKLLKHGNGLTLCTIYAGGDPAYGDSKRQGPIIAFNLSDRAGNWIRKSDVEQLAIANSIQLRTGGVCNPGGIADSLNLSPTEMKDNYAEGLRCGNEVDILNGKPTGVVRVSLGAMTTLQDVDHFLSFLGIFVDGGPSPALGTVVFVEALNGRTMNLESGKAAVDPACNDDMHWLCPVATCRQLLPSGEVAKAHFSTHDRVRTGRKPWLKAITTGCRATKTQ